MIGGTAMRHYTVLRLLLSGFLLYIAWPYLSTITTTIEKVFWACWLSFLLLVIGGNLATGMRLSKPPVMERDVQQQVRNR